MVMVNVAASVPEPLEMVYKKISCKVWELFLKASTSGSELFTV
jgi:hypothetical protein